MSFRKQYNYRGRADKGAWLVLDEASDEPVRFFIYGKDGTAWQKQLSAWAARRLQHRKRFNADLDLSLEEQQQLNYESAAALVGAWESGGKRKLDEHGKPIAPPEWDWTDAKPTLEVVDGEEWPCTTANAQKLFELFPSVYDLVDEFASDRANYPPDADIVEARLTTNADYQNALEKNSSPGLSGDSANPAQTGIATAAA